MFWLFAKFYSTLHIKLFQIICDFLIEVILKIFKSLPELFKIREIFVSQKAEDNLQINLNSYFGLLTICMAAWHDIAQHMFEVIWVFWA